MIEFRFSRLLAGLAALTLSGTPLALHAQTAASSALDIPEDASLLQESDPNVRTATAVVNGTVITRTDIEQRLALLLASANLPPEQMQAARMRIFRNLIDETLQIQAAEAQEMPVTDQEVEARYVDIARRNGQEAAGMDEALRAMGSSPPRSSGRSGPSWPGSGC